MCDKQGDGCELWIVGNWLIIVHWLIIDQPQNRSPIHYWQSVCQHVTGCPAAISCLSIKYRLSINDYWLLINYRSTFCHSFNSIWVFQARMLKGMLSLHRSMLHGTKIENGRAVCCRPGCTISCYPLLGSQAQVCLLQEFSHHCSMTHCAFPRTTSSLLVYSEMESQLPLASLSLL